MRGEPVHLCTTGHQPICYRGETCPFCAALRRIAELEAIVARLDAARPARPAAPTEVR